MLSDYHTSLVELIRKEKGGECLDREVLATFFLREVDVLIIYNVSAMNWLLAVSCWLLAIGTIGAIRVIGSLTSDL